VTFQLNPVELCVWSRGRNVPKRTDSKFDILISYAGWPLCLCTQQWDSSTEDTSPMSVCSNGFCLRSIAIYRFE
jgi:hypothetical protein